MKTSAHSRFVLAALALLLITGLAGASGQPEEGDLREVTVVLDWLPNTNHAGLYLALERGWFQDEGLDVEIVQPSELGSDQLVASGRGEFGVSHQEAVTFARTADEALPIVAIGTILQHNTSGYAVPADRDVEDPGDFVGLRYGGWGTAYEDAMLNAVMSPFNADAGDVTTVNVGTTDIFAAFRREIDMTWIFYGWDGVRAEIEGVELDYFPLVDLDERLDYYTPLFIAREELLREEPGLARAFMRAVSRGYQTAAADPATAAALLREYAPEIDARLAEESLIYLSDYFLDDSGSFGTMDPAVWEAFTGFMNEQDLLPNPMEVEAAFSNEYLPQ